MGRKILIASHGRLAEGLADSLSYIIGGKEKIETMCAYTDPDFNLEKEVKILLEKHKSDGDELVVFTDVFGGSVNNEFIRNLNEYQFHLIANVNFPILLEILLDQNPLTTESITDRVGKGSCAPKYCNSLLTQRDNNEEDDL